MRKPLKAPVIAVILVFIYVLGLFGGLWATVTCPENGNVPTWIIRQVNDCGIYAHRAGGYLEQRRYGRGHL